MIGPDAPEVARAALTAARAILEAEGANDLSESLADAELVVAGADETWEVGSRSVKAYSLALVLSPTAFVALRDAAKLERVREALAATLRSPGTEMGPLGVVIRLPGIERTWGHAYRGSARAIAERPSDEAVKAGAEELALALGDKDAAASLSTALLESAEVPSSGHRLLRRYVLRLTPRALARAERHRAFADRLRWLIEHAATRAVEAVSEVELRLRLGGDEDD